MKLRILVIGRNLPILETVLRLINSKENWQAVGAATDEEAMNLFKIQPVDLVLIGGGVEESSEQFFSDEFKKLNPAIRIIRHFGGGSGLLFNEILEATSGPPSL